MAYNLIFDIRYSLFLYLFTLLIVAGNVHAGASAFIPRYVDYSSELVLRSMIDGGETSSNNSSTKKQDILFQEYLGLNGAGYIYSPTFITLLSEISLGLKQESLERNNRSVQQNNTLFQFRQELILLPNHPYNLHLYAGRSDEMQARTNGPSSTVRYEWGARARYRKQPWESTLIYTHFDTSSLWDSSTDTFGANLYYFDTLTFWNANVNYNHYLSSSYNDQSITAKDVFSAHISKKWDSFRFISRGTLDQHNQEDHYRASLNIPDYTETRERWEWFNELAADLPHNIRSVFSYRKRHSSANFQRSGTDGSAKSDTDNYRLNFTHHLYKSLITTLNSGYHTTESLGGETAQKDVSLGTSYSKIIRWGTFGTNLYGGINDATNTGGTTTLSERHTLTVSSPTSFTLNSTVLAPDTIRVSVIDSFNNGMIIPLIRDVHYTVIRVGEAYRILILSLPPALSEPWTEYIYIVDYENIASDYTIRSTNWGGEVKMSLFNKTITPHAGYRQSSQKLADGFYPGIFDNSRTYNVGINAQYKNIQGDVTKSWRNSVTENEEHFLAYLNSSYKFSELTGGSYAISYENKIIEQTYTSTSNREPILEEDIYSGYVQAFTSWPEWALNGTIGVTYSLYLGLGESTNGSINSSLTWRIGTMDINMRLSYHESESKIKDSVTDSNYYTAWLTIRRKLF